MASELVEPFAAPEFFVDGWDEIEVSGGVIRSAGYRLIRGEKIVVVRIIMLASRALADCSAATEIIHAAEHTQALMIFDGPKMVS